MSNEQQTWMMHRQGCDVCGGTETCPSGLAILQIWLMMERSYAKMALAPIFSDDWDAEEGDTQVDMPAILIRLAF